MPEEYPARPVPWPQAFGRTDRPALLSQAALLLLLGAELRGDPDSLRARARATARQREVEVIPASDAALFAVPRLELSGARIAVEAVQTRLGQRYGRRFRRTAPGQTPSAAPPDLLSDLAGRVRRTPTETAAADLMEASLRHSETLVQVAAAASYFGLSADPARLLPVLVRGTRSRDELTRDVAAIALARVAPDHPRLGQLTRARPRRRRRRRAHTSLLVHGTFARDASWWQPGGDFHTYLRGSVRPDLYNASDRFDWSGGYTDAARAVGADDLRTWVLGHSALGLDLFTHSHGGSVAMLASHRPDMRVCELVLLSCPVHVHKYMPNFPRVAEVVSIRVHLDLVILIDGGGQRFRHPKIRENVLPIWFDHSATHEPDVWQTHNVPSLL